MRSGFNKQRVVVAVLQDVHHLQVVSGSFSLRPQALLRTTVKGYLFFPAGLVNGIFVHESKHQHFPVRES